MKKAVNFLFLVFSLFFVTSCPPTKTYKLYIGQMGTQKIDPEYNIGNFKEIYNNQGKDATVYEFILTDGPNNMANIVGLVKEPGIVTWNFNYNNSEFEVTDSSLMTPQDGYAQFEGRLKNGVNSAKITVKVSFKKFSTEKVINVRK